jgi:predicted DNA-binding transcriptional regulator YafY
MRCQNINDRLNLRFPHSATKQELINLCNISERTLKNDLSYMREEFSAPIIYDRVQKGYRYTEKFELVKLVILNKKELTQLRVAAETLAQYRHLEVFKGLRNIIEKLEYAVKINPVQIASQHIYFEHIPYVHGTEYISFLLEAIEDKAVIEFDYHAFDKPKLVHRIFHPYVLKEHSNRWYVIGWLPEFETMVTYALDRIVNNENRRFLDTTFKIQTDFSLDKYLEFTYGIGKGNGPAEEVILEFNYLQGRYFLSKPFFKYETIIDDAEVLTIRMQVIINFEFIRKLCSFGENVKVMKPKHLAESVMEYHQKAIQKYLSI